MDLEQLTDEELGVLAGGGGLNSLSNEALERIASGGASQEPYLIRAVKQFGSGTIESTPSIFALAADLNPMQAGGPKLDFPASKLVKSLTDKVTAKEDPETRYFRTAGEFVGPQGIFGLAGKALKAVKGSSVLADFLLKQITPTALASATTGALGAQAAEDVTGDKNVAPLVGAVVGGAIPSVFSSALKAGRSLIFGATPEEIKGSAALAQRELTGLSEDAIAQAMKGAPQDNLGKLMTTAEVTDNAGMAQIEKTLSSADDPARIYAARAAEREKARNALLEMTTSTPGINKEALGTKLINKAGDVAEQTAIEETNLWAKVPRYKQIDVSAAQDSLSGMLRARQGGLPPGSKVQTLIDQMLDPKLGNVRTSGMLQDIRSDALKLSRDANLDPFETRLLNDVQTTIDEAMEKGLKGGDYDSWKLARETTAKNRETFARGTAGGALTEKMARPSNVLANALKGDTRSIQELKAAIRGDPGLIEDVKRGVIDSIPRDAQGNLTANSMKKFLAANEGGIKELFGPDHFDDMQRILQDLQSESKVGQIAFKSSKGGSVTAQRGTVAGAIQDTLLGSLIPGSGSLARLADAVKRTANVNDAKSVQELLFRAAMDPSFALELAKTPTTTRIFSILDQLKNLMTSTLAAGTKSGALELSRTENTSKPPRAKPQSVFNLYNTEPIQKKNSMNAQETNSKLTAETLRDAVIAQESGGKANAISDAGAVGLMQLMPSTAKEVAAELGLTSYDLKDPEVNKQMGTYYLQKMLDAFGGDPELALTAYHSGPGRVKKLLELTGGKTLQDILLRLGPVGQRYAKQVLARLPKGVVEA